MVVFQDKVNTGRNSFLSDTARPTLGLKSRNDRRMHRDAGVNRPSLQYPWSRKPWKK